MPQVTCPVCKKLQPIRWERTEQQWRFWPHGPVNKRCRGSEKPLKRKV